MLALNVSDLNDLISETAEKNPLLELDWSGIHSTHTSEGTYETTIPAQEDPLADLTLQYHIVCSNPIQNHIGDFLIYSLDERGYLDTTIQEAARYLGTPEMEVERALIILQSLEPAGVGARNLRESLCLQLQRQPAPDVLALSIVVNCFEQLVARDTNAIAEVLSMPAASVEKAMRLIQSLNPTPFYGMASSEVQHYAVPELYVYVQNGELRVVSIDRTPTLSVAYSNTLFSGDIEAKNWGGNLMNEVKQLIAAVHHRQSTLLSIGKSIVSSQRSFFVSGNPPVALTQENVANELNMSISTISRGIREKYLQFDRKVYPLKYFFPPRIAAGVSREEIKSVIRSVIANENPLHPVSDGQLARYLASVGQPVNRRTVTKYRQGMDIPQSEVRTHKAE